MASVLLLTKFGSLGASSRVRCLQYVPHLENRGFEFDVYPLIDNDILAYKYKYGTFPLGRLLVAFINRINLAMKTGAYDTVWIHKELFPFLPAFFDSMFLSSRNKLVVDLDDAEFLKYRKSAGLKGRLFANKYVNIFSRVNHIVVGNSYLAEMALEEGDFETPISVIPSVIDTDHYGRKKVDRSSEKLVFGWMGTGYTEKYVEPVIDLFAGQSDFRDFEFRLVGASPKLAYKPNTHVITWKESTEVDEINRFDIGLMPLVDDVWERGKCGYKAIQYMGCGLPVMVSPVGVNRTLVEHEVNGFHIISQEDWLEFAMRLAESSSMRRSMGDNNLRKIEERYSIRSQVDKLARILA